MTTERQIVKAAKTVFGASNDAAFWDGLRTRGPGWARRYLVAAIERGADRIGNARAADKALAFR